MKIPREVMNVAMSEICQKYDAEYWVWTPATFDLKNKKLRHEEIEKHELFTKLARVWMPFSFRVATRATISPKM